MMGGRTTEMRAEEFLRNGLNNTQHHPQQQNGQTPVASLKLLVAARFSAPTVLQPLKIYGAGCLFVKSVVHS